MKMGNVEVECVKGNIVEQHDIEAVVNAANAMLKPGGGVAGAIHKAAGPGLYQECKPLAPIKTGEAVITSGHMLPNAYVIHALGPVYAAEEDPAAKLAETYRNCLLLADEKGIKSIAFPAISTGIFGYPMEDAARVAFETIKETAPKLKNLKLIRFVLFAQQDYQVHQRVMEEVVGKGA